MHTRNRTTTAAFGLVAALLLALPSAAATNDFSTAVSCDGITVKDAAKVNHRAGGTLTIRQRSTNPVSSTWTTGRSNNGNQLTWKKVSDSTQQSWTGVIGSDYTVRAYRSGAANCNGAWPGHGNYTWNYRVVHNVG